jgi:hypothetical protein
VGYGQRTAAADNEQLLQGREQICHQAERGYQGSAYHGSAYHSSSQTEEITRTQKKKNSLGAAYFLLGAGIYTQKAVAVVSSPHRRFVLQ